MKKYLIVLAAAAVVLASCKTEEAYKSISFKEADRIMVYGEQAQFSVMWEPANLPEPKCTWESSDTTVLKVDENGIVTAAYLGEANIIAKYNDLSAICHVTVEQYEAMWAPSTDIYYFPSTKSAEPINDSLYTFEYPSGIYECKMHTVDIIITNSIEFDGGIGEGDCIHATISALFITKTPEGKESFLGEIWDLGLVIVEDSATYKAEQMSEFPGTINIDVTGPAWQTLFEALDDEEADQQAAFAEFSEAYKEGVSGAHMASTECTATGASWYPWYDGIVKSGYIIPVWDDANEEYVLNYKFRAQWCYGYVAGFYTGLQLNYEAESYSEILAQPFEEHLSGVWYYEAGKMGVLETAAANSRRAPKHNFALKVGDKITRDMVKLEICKERAVVEGRIK